MWDPKNKRWREFARGHNPKNAKPLAQRFWRHVQIGETEECWPWQGRRQRQGYGQINADGSGSRLSAHRVAFELTFGLIPEGLFICHSCDNPPCCNPAHLFVGDHAANAADMMAKGRHSTHWTSTTAPRPTKLTDAQVLEIRRRYSDGETQRVLAAEFSLKQVTISQIVSRRTWRHLP